MNVARRWTFALWRTWQWWRHTAWFQGAHKPLCHRFEHGVLRIGPWCVCRGCTLLMGGLVFAALSLAWLRPSQSVVVGLTVAVLTLTLPLSYPPWYAHFPRPFRDAIRFLGGTLMSLIVALVIMGAPAKGLLAAVIFAIVARYFRHLRTAAKRHACDGCPELDGASICSGYRQQAESIRVYSLCVEEKLNTPEHFVPQSRPLP